MQKETSAKYVFTEHIFIPDFNPRWEGYVKKMSTGRGPEASTVSPKSGFIPHFIDSFRQFMSQERTLRSRLVAAKI